MDVLVIEKFWTSVEKTDACWLWKGYLDKSGLPIIRAGTRDSFQEYSSRHVTLELAGAVLPRNTKVVPKCGVRLCVNPDHLAYDTEARFWLKVQKLSEVNGSCWVWTANQDKDMYGKFKANGKDIRAHVYSWELHTGRPVPDSLLVCHTCDHPYCVNPAHLFLGTCKDNHLDREMKGRGATSKLIPSQVREIRELHTIGSTVMQLSQQYAVSTDCIYDIIKRRKWKWVT